jgi:cytochrome c2
MKFALKGAAAMTLVLALAACGQDQDPVPAETTAATATAAPAGGQEIGPRPTDVASSAATPASTPSASASASPAPTPTPTPTPKASPSAKATPVAMVSKPAEFAQCSACHSTEKGKNGIGPSLAGVYGDKAATVPGYDFSDAMKASGLTWNQANLDRFLTDPRGVVPGTKMTFPGLKDAAKRQAVIAYLKAI